MVLVFNKGDLARRRGFSTDTACLSSLFGAPVIETVATEGEGIAALKDAIVAAAISGKKPHAPGYGPEIDSELELLEPLTRSIPGLAGRRNPRWTALKLLENDAALSAVVAGSGDAGARLLSAVGDACRRIEKHFGDSTELVIADRRYGFISGACQECARSAAEGRHSSSDRIDEILTSKVVGLPIFLLLMYLLFKLTFTLGSPLSGLIEMGLAGIGRFIERSWPPGAPELLRALLTDGVLGGVGGVLIFAPNIALLFAAIAILEESGYMARGVFLVDSFMHKVGLHGRSFVPLIVGLGCTVPAILATRALGDRRTRMTTIMLLPLISCGARFPIYSLLTAAMFPPQWRARILMSIYLVGVVLAGLLARLLRDTVFRGETAPFVMELPPYRTPTLNAVLRHTGERLGLFLRKAATIILAASVIMWAMSTFPRTPGAALAGLSSAEARKVELENSAAGRIGMWLEPVMRHAGFDWQASTALIGAFAAKEVFVAQLGILNAQDATDEGLERLSRKIGSRYTPLQAYCIMLFCLISLPCVATFAVVRAETGAWRWAIVQMAGLTFLAYAVSFIVYHVGLFLRIGTGIGGS
jgi:ferrous iron transport protein B